MADDDHPIVRGAKLLDEDRPVFVVIDSRGYVYGRHVERERAEKEMWKRIEDARGVRFHIQRFRNLRSVPESLIRQANPVGQTKREDRAAAARAAEREQNTQAMKKWKRAGHVVVPKFVPPLV